MATRARRRAPAPVSRRADRRERGLARGAGQRKEERDNRPGPALEEPRLPAPPGRGRPAGWTRRAGVRRERVNSLARVRHVVLQTFSSGAPPAARTATTAAARASAAPGRVVAGRWHRAAPAQCRDRCCERSGVRKQRQKAAWRRTGDWLQVGEAALRSRSAGMPTTCSMLASPSSHQAFARAAATRCGSAPKPSRSSDDAPPWQRGPAGRRDGERCRDGRREEGMERGFRSIARRQHPVAGPRV